MRDLSRLCLAALLTATTACGADAPEGKGDPSPEPERYEESVGKADSFFNPTEHGLTGFSSAVPGEFKGSANFHAYDFTLRGEASVSIETFMGVGGDPALDTVLYLYRQQADGRWGRYVAKNDDFSGAHRWSRIADLKLTAGSYRAIVKTYRYGAEGPFNLIVDCAGDGCGPRPVGDTDECLFGITYADLAHNPNVSPISQHTLRKDVALSPRLEAQIVAAVASNYDEVRQLDDAYAAVDQGEIFYTLLQDKTHGGTYTAVEYGAGDNSYGAILFGGTTEIAAGIGDGDLYSCKVHEASDRFAGLELVAADLPASLAEIPGLKAMQIKGFDASQGFDDGDHLSVGAMTRVILDRAHAVVGGDCDGLPEGRGADFGWPLPDYELPYFFERGMEGWESALTADQAAALTAYVEAAGEGAFRGYQTALRDNTCGGDGAGVVTFMHNRLTDELLMLVSVEWAE